MQNENWRLLFSSNNLYEVELLRGYLIENQIESVILNKKDSLYLIGEYELYVALENLILAKHLLNKINERE